MCNIKVVYEDCDLLAVVKPVGVPIAPDRTGDQDLLQMLEKKYGTLGMIHRLDRPVGGVVLLAKNKKAEAYFSKEMQERRILKNYLAVVHGEMPEKKGELVHYLKKNNSTNLSVAVSPQDKRGKKAILQYETLAQENETSLLLIHLLTGRHHQIRAQLSITGCPILGDRKYGSRERGNSFPALWCLSMKGQKEDGSTVLATALPDAEVFLQFSYPLEQLKF